MKKLFTTLLAIVMLVATLSCTTITSYAASKPSAPKGVTLTTTSSSVTVKWGKVSGATGYYVKYATSLNGTYKSVKITKGSTVTKTISSLLPNQKYYVKVAAYNKAGTGKYSSTVYKSTLTRYPSQKQQVNMLNCGHIGFTDSFFAMIDTDGNLYGAKSRSYDLQELLTTDDKTYISNVGVYGKYIYFTAYFYSDSDLEDEHLTDYGIYRCNLDGSNQTCIKCFIPSSPSTTGYNIRFIFGSNCIIYSYVEYDLEEYEDTVDKLYYMDMSGNNTKCIGSYNGGNFYSYSNKVYYITGSKLGCFDTSSKTTTTKSLAYSMKYCTLVGMEGYKLYYSKESDDIEKNYVYKIDTSNSNKITKIVTVNNGEPVHSMVVYRDKVYVTTGTGEGNRYATVNSKGKLSYPYNNVVGECMGFYKDRIMCDTLNSYSLETDGHGIATRVY